MVNAMKGGSEGSVCLLISLDFICASKVHSRVNIRHQTLELINSGLAHGWAFKV